MDALLDWKADIHLCGEHLAETLWAPDGPKTDHWVGVFDTCVACNAIERDQKARSEKDGKDVLTAGRMWRAMKLEDAMRIAKEQSDRTK